MMTVSPTFVLGRQLQPARPFTPKIEPILASNNDGRAYISRPISARITNFAGYSNKIYRNTKTQKRPLTARTFAQHTNLTSKKKKNNQSLSMSISYGNINDTKNFYSIFNPINCEEKPRWLISSQSGTIYKDRQTRVNQSKETKQKLKPKIIRALKNCYKKIENEEIRKHEQRMRILYRFRLRRLENTEKCKNGSILQNKPIIFIPELNENINPYNPSINEMEHYLADPNGKIERLSEPKLRCSAQTPLFADFDVPEIRKIIKSIKDLKNIRHQYHWRSFAHRNNGDYDYHDDNKSQCTVDTVDTVSTCSGVSCINSIQQISPSHMYANQRIYYGTVQQNKNNRKERKECMDELTEFENKLGYLTRAEKNKIMAN